MLSLRGYSRLGFVMKSVFILTCVNAPNNIEYTITYLPLFPAHNLAPERDRSCPMSPSDWPVSSVMQLCLYRLLAVTSAVFSHADCTGVCSPSPSRLAGLPVGRCYASWYCFTQRCSCGVCPGQSLSTPPITLIL